MIASSDCEATKAPSANGARKSDCPGTETSVNQPSGSRTGGTGTTDAELAGSTLGGVEGSALDCGAAATTLCGEGAWAHAAASATNQSGKAGRRNKLRMLISRNCGQILIVCCLWKMSIILRHRPEASLCRKVVRQARRDEPQSRNFCTLGLYPAFQQ